MSISQALNNAASGLTAVSRQAGIASQNIANALTPGYSRREADLAERTVAGGGAGVRVAGVTRASIPALTAERRAAGAALDGLEAGKAALEKISRLLGGPEDPNALFQSVTKFSRSLQDLANMPSSASAQQSTAAAASDLVLRVNNIADGYQRIRSDADHEISRAVAALNNELRRIGELNDEIARSMTSGRDSSALLDQRDAALDKISSLIPVRPLVRENGRIDIMTQQGVMLFAGTAREVEFTGSATVTAGMTLSNGALSGLSVDGIDITPGVSNRASSEGKITGLFAVRDAIVVAAANELDAWVEDLVSRFSDPNADPTLTPGVPGIFTDQGASLTPPVAAGLAGRLSLNPAVDPAQGGAAWRFRDGVAAAAPGPASSDLLLRNLISVLEAPAPSASNGGLLMSALEGASALSGNASGVLKSASSGFEAAEAYHQALHDAELAETGVDTDAELQQLLLIEQAYAANARLIQVVGEMIDRLMEI